MDTQRLHLDLRLLAAKEGPVVAPVRPISHHKSEAAAPGGLRFVLLSYCPALRL